MRDIGLFKAKRKDNGEWVEGSLIHSGDYWAILQNESALHPAGMPYLDSETGTFDGKATPITPKTVCEFTGLTDKNDKRIFEGDIVSGVFKNSNAEVLFFIGMWAGHSGKGFTDLADKLNEIEIIGNKFDNPELLEMK